MFTTINVISRNEETQLYGTMLPTELTNEDIRNSESYKEYYAIASGKIPPKTKASKKKADTDATTKQKPPTVPKEKKGKKSGKGKQKAKELETISEAVLTEAEQLKIITKRSRKETHSSHASGSGIDEGTGVSPEVPDAPDYDSNDNISWKSSEDDQDGDKNDDDENAQDDQDDDKNDDDEAQTESEDDGDDFIHPKLTTHDDETTHEEETDEDDTFDPIVQSTCTSGSVPAVHESVQPWLSNLARRQDPRESFDELTDTTFDFSAFVMNRLNVTTLTPELLAGPTFELMKGTCKSLTELEYFCEEVYKATTEKLDWINPEGRQYPHDLRKPLPLVPNSQGRHVIPFHHFINNDLEYLRGGESSRKYSTLVTKTKAADYGQIKWIEDLVPNSMESARDVYSKRRTIAVTKVEIVEWKNYKHLDWITIRRDDDILYKFKEGDFHRLRIQDIEDMLLLLVQGKHVEDLQLGVESYQKKLNLTKPDTYRSNLRRRDAYTPYSDPRGFIYENKDKKNRLMRIDELHKFSDGTLDDVRTALNDRLKGIRMEYLPQTFWSQRDKANARAMIQAIDKRLKTRRIMRSLERFVGGRPYGGDLRLLQRTI
ncbi:hypothetical protein Tco_0836478 [Tanacetum coccineum]